MRSAFSFVPRRARFVGAFTITATLCCVTAAPSPVPQLSDQSETDIAPYRNARSYVDRTTSDLIATIPDLKGLDPETQAAAYKAFDYARQAEVLHAQFYKAALERVKAGEDLPVRKLFVCKYCGHTCYDEAPDKCPVCGAAKEDFLDIA